MCILLLDALTAIPEEPRCPFSSSIPPLLISPLHPILDHTSSVTSLTSIYTSNHSASAGLFPLAKKHPSPTLPLVTTLLFLSLRSQAS